VKFALLCLLTPAFAPAQAPRIGVIDFYGLRKVSEERVRKAMGVKEGDPLPPSKADVEERLETVQGVVRARLQAACCDSGNAILYVGIEEKGAAHYNFRVPPDKELSLPEEIVAAYRSFLQAEDRSSRKEQVREDLTRGHALSSDPDVLVSQFKFLAYASENVPKLREVLRDAADPEQRTIAAYVIGYAPKKEQVINDLQYALQDPEDGVRQNAMQALGAIAVLAARKPDLELRISPTWFIEMLNSLLWDDRLRAAKALVNLTDRRDPTALDQLRARALPALIDMARWKSLDHALPAFILLGRAMGLSEQAIQDAWSGGERNTVIEKAAQSEHAKK
jgi:HEAT repeat protein